MANSYYKADDVKANVAIKTYLANQGIKVIGSHFKPTWRPSDRPSCQFYTKTNGWYDFVKNTGGSVIDLAMLVEGLTFPEAVNALGERYGVTPTKGKKRPPKKPKPKVVPDWVRVSWLLIHKDDDALLLDAMLRLNKDEDQLTDIDLKWARRVALLLANEMRGATLGEAVGVAIKLYHATEAKNRSASGKESAI